MSGRGLGITGGTVDKLESIPGFRMDLTPEEMKEQAKKIGIAITGQSPNLAPADKTLYALRDATATTENIPLITSSILSKKIAGGCEYLSLDVKCGSGAFMKTFDKAQQLAQWLKRIGEQAGLKVHAVITDMDQPLGSAIGNAIEVKEALQVLGNQNLTSPVERFRQLCITLCGETLHFVGQAATTEVGIAQAHDALTSGRALTKCREWFVAQGANGEVVDGLGGTLHVTSKSIHFLYPQKEGYLARLDAGVIGEAVVAMGGGREKKDDVIDPSVGITINKMVGDHVAANESILTIRASSNESAQAAARAIITGGIEISPTPVPARPVILATL
jgi:pyrimidine-nucleoside phosphorylase